METKNDKKMTRNGIQALKDAIKHCSEVENSCVEVMCSLEHKQLRIWLTELLEIKTKAI